MHNEFSDALRNARVQVLGSNDALVLAVAKDTSFSNSVNMLYGTPEGVYIWKYEVPDTYALKHEAYIEKLVRAARRHQYTVAMKQDNVMIGQWASVMQQHARLLAQVASPETEYVYKNVLRANPTNYEAHGEYIGITKNKAEAVQSAEIIARSAEDQKLLDLAAKTLGKRAPAIADVLLLSAQDNGFRVILIPLEPCNPWLLEEIARTYEQITQVPVIIRRLPVEWKVPEPVRSSYRPYLEQIAGNIWKKDENDFTQWPLPKLKSELAQAARREGTEATTFIEQLFRNMEESGNQYDAEPMMIRLSQIGANHLPGDPHTMVVGITGLDIFSADSNYIFSLHGGLNAAPASILSYARMTARMTGENQSRKRLVERAAKALVSASLKRLDIPVSIDPLCPYSYSDGLQRLDEKSLTLSSPVAKRLDAIRQARKPAK